MICPSCGTNCADGMKFCVICGNPFSAAPAEPVAAAPAEPVVEPVNTYVPESNTFENTTKVDDPYAQSNFSGFTAPTPAPAYSSYSAPEYQPVTEATLPDHLKPLSPWAYLGYMLLFSLVPCAGIIMAFIFAFSSEGNVNRRNFARYYLLSLLIGLVLGILYCVVIFALLGSSISGGYYY